MLKKELTLSDVADYFRKNQIPSFEEEIDEYGGHFITAARLAAVILAPNPIIALSNFCSGIDAASLRISKLFSWLPDKFKYGNKGREIFAVKRYELSSIIYIKLLDIAFFESFKSKLSPTISFLLEDISLSEDDRDELNQITKEAEKSQLKISIDTFATINKVQINELASKIIEPIIHFLVKNSKKTDKVKKVEAIDLNTNTIKEQFADNAYNLLNAFLINFISEFPEFSLWCDFQSKEKLLVELENIKRSLLTSQDQKKDLLSSIKGFEENIKASIEKLTELKKDEFIKIEGLPSFEYIFDKLYKFQPDSIIDKIDDKVKSNITAHHNLIRSETDKALADNDDIPDIIYPKNKEIYIAQSFSSITYNKKEHKKIFLTTKGFDKSIIKGEDIGKYLLKVIVDPNTILRPIIILGNPGAGKSMFSKMFSAKLCDTNEYIPFLVRLRDVASSSSNISEHINKGIAKSIGLTQDINWIEWTKLLKTRIPVIILDGFDELMQSSNIELNGYINSIRDLQETALNHDICLKVILTSRIAVMQDVSIPDGTTIIKLEPFDSQRKSLWIDKWNSFQNKTDYKFSLPNNQKILELAQEPLLLFMLAVYDFPHSELQSIAQDISFNQSKLYDSLLKDFGIRQLEKEEEYRNAGPEVKKKEEELFRLRLGMISLLMFINDTTNKDIARLDEELKICKLNDSKIKPLDVLTGFFFVHQNKSTSENEFENFNYEFLHKSFGEFLTADFLLKISFKQKDRNTRDIELFKFCYGYNWLHKHPEIQRFLFEHVSQVFNLKSNDQAWIIEKIQDEISELFEKTINDFPISRFTIVEPKSKIEHLAIYSQNLIFLWLSLSGTNQEICFDISNSLGSTSFTQSTSEKDSINNYVAQDREELDQTKLLWKRITNLWQLVGNYQSVAKLNEWIEVIEKEKIILKRRGEKIEIRNNFSDSSKVSCNDFNYILSLFDNDNKMNQANFDLKKIKNISEYKPELTQLSNDAILYRMSSKEGFKEIEQVLHYLVNNKLSPKQLEDLTDKFIALDGVLSTKKTAEIGEKIFSLSYNSNASVPMLKLFNYLFKYKYYYPVSQIYDQGSDILRRTVFRSFESNFRENSLHVNQIFKLTVEVVINPETRNFINFHTIRELFRRIEKEFKISLHKNPQLIIEYVRGINKLSKVLLNRDFYDLRIFEEHFKRFEDNFERFYSGLISRANKNPLVPFEYLKLFIEVSENSQMRSFIRPQMVSELLRWMINDFKDINSSNPQFFFEYIVIVNKLIKISSDLEFFDKEVFGEYIKHLLSEITNRGFRNPLLLLEYLKLLVEVSENPQMRDFVRPQIVSELLRQTVNEFRRTVSTQDSHQFSFEYISTVNKLLQGHLGINFFSRDIFEDYFKYLYSELSRKESINPFLAIQYLTILIEINNNPVYENFIPPQVISELIYRYITEIRYVNRENPQIVIEFFIVLNKSNYNSILLDIFPGLKQMTKNSLLDFGAYFNIFLDIFQE